MTSDGYPSVDDMLACKQVGIVCEPLVRSMALGKLACSKPVQVLDSKLVPEQVLGSRLVLEQVLGSRLVLEQVLRSKQVPALELGSKLVLELGSRLALELGSKLAWQRERERNALACKPGGKQEPERSTLEHNG